VLARLAGRLPVAVLSGRGREDVEKLMGIDGIVYAGSHGFDIAGPGVRWEMGEGIPEEVARAAGELRARLGRIAGALVEDKRFAATAHYRLVAEEEVPAVERVVREVAAGHPGLKVAGGLSLIGAVVAEIAAGSAGAGSGLAYRIMESQFRLNIPRLCAALALLAATGVIIFLALSALSHLLLRRWHESALKQER